MGMMPRRHRILVRMTVLAGQKGLTVRLMLDEIDQVVEPGTDGGCVHSKEINSTSSYFRFILPYRSHWSPARHVLLYGEQRLI